MVYVLLTLIFIFGLIIGSFLNCLVWRLHKKEGLWSRSYCPKCRHKIFWYDNIPVLSFFLLRGKCRHCQKRISWQYPAVELVTGILFAVAFLNNFQFPISNFQFPILKLLTFNFFFLILRDFFIISVMVVVFVYDLRWYLILDIITLPACAIVFALNLFLGISWQNMLISGIIGAGFFLLQFIISRGKWIGGGDIRLGLLMGIILGWPLILAALFLAYFIGSIIGIGLILSGKKKWGSKIPLGIFLSTACVITLFWGERILEWYLGIIRF